MGPFKKAVLGGALLFGVTAVAQQPREQPKQPEGDLVTRMMAFDKNKDGKLTKDEISEERVIRIFERADANKDGTVTVEELKALAAQEAAIGGGDRGKGGKEGPGGERGKGDRGKGGPGGERGREGPGGFRGFAPPAPGTILPPFMVEQLKLTDDQKKKLEELQNDVKAKIDGLLTEEQRRMLREMMERGPGRGPGGDRRPEGGDRRPEGGERRPEGRPPEGGERRPERKADGE